MNRKILILSLLVAGLILAAAGVRAEVTYPVAELNNCASEQECQAYCDNIENVEQCLTAAEKYGMMTSDEIKEAKKMLPYMLKGETPGGCKSEAECNAYCNNDANVIECVDFGVKVGMISAEEAAMVKKTGGKGPGGCKGKEECDAFCNQEENIVTCVDFAVQYGMMDAKEAEMVKKTGGKGPGGCSGKEECDAYCKANMKECFQFAVENGMAPEMTEDQLCMTNCLFDGGANPEECSPSSQESTCVGCAQKCFPREEKPTGEGQRQGNYSGESSGIPEGEYDNGVAGGGSNGTEPGDGSYTTPGDYSQTNPGDESGVVHTEGGPAGDGSGGMTPGEGEAPPGGGSGGTAPGDESMGATPGDGSGGGSVGESSSASGGGESAPSDSGSAPTGAAVSKNANSNFDLRNEIMKFLFRMH